MFKNHRTQNDLYVATKAKQMNNILCKITFTDTGLNQKKADG